ncbi:MAG: polyamine aminopropyltransferase [SAR324 cluster bacterium]|nr:polyamine aminopropyltransferase [SAR324 cluster bacterium]
MEDGWFLEKHTPHAGLTLAVKERLYEAKSAYQSLEVLDTFEFGRMLLLDGYVMLTERDEFIYHEMIVHPALTRHARPERVLIVGGGDGGSVREVLRHPTIGKIHLVEIDQMVIDVSREYFPQVAAGLDDARVEIHVGDGFDRVERARAEFDVIIVDSIDPMGEAAKLFSATFYGHARRALREGGILVCQTESPFYNGNVVKGVIEKLRGLFTHAAPYIAHIPTYPSGLWSFSFASDAVDPKTAPLRPEPEFLSALKYYTPQVSQAAFTTPRYMQTSLEQ